jgi:hypothetical protein
LILKYLTIIFIFFISLSSLKAQKTGSQTVDSLRKVVVDSVKKLLPDSAKSKRVILRQVFGLDSIRKKDLPKVALYRSLILPGWGQRTNRQTWLIPIIYSGVGGGVYSVWFNNSKYKFYKGYLEEAQKGAVKITFSDGVERGPFTKEQISPQVNTYRRYRDLTWIVFAMGWTLQAIQANAQAHLRTFDTSDDISFKIEPDFQNTFGNASIGVKLTISKAP